MASQFEQFMIQRVESMGWDVLNKGWPDLLLHKNGKFLAVEVKSKSDKLKPHQEVMLLALCKAGVECRVAYEDDLVNGKFTHSKFYRKNDSIAEAWFDYKRPRATFKAFEGLGIS
jgi:Holliday junction resolvase